MDLLFMKASVGAISGFQNLGCIGNVQVCSTQFGLCWALVLLWFGCMMQSCLFWSVGLGVIVGLGLGQLWVSKCAV